MFETVPEVVLQIDIEQSLEDTIDDVIAFLPRLIGALIILIIGWILGRVLGGIVERLVDAVELDRLVLDTPLGRALGGTERAVSHAFGLITRWFVYALAILAAVDILAISTLSEWINDAVSYLPAFVAGLLILVLGFVVADFIGDIIVRTGTSIRSMYREWVATAVQVFLYFVVVVIALDTMGIDVEILFVFARALVWGLAAAIAIAIGIAFGLGGQDYVENNIGRWTREGKSEVRSSGNVDDRDLGTDGGTDADDRQSD
ncbi:hypothetical protein BRC65_04905 [Halobacteriales archaeon QH_2_65_14]|nr:MAG: hypothetical protein BRC65_04905 [Halobacteriales archaeon QH_2_65_14]